MYAGGAERLTRECCVQNFQAALKVMTARNTLATIPETTTPNRASINIAPGGFPFTRILYPNGIQIDAPGMQVDFSLPTYILQA